MKMIQDVTTLPLPALPPHPKTTPLRHYFLILSWFPLSLCLKVLKVYHFIVGGTCSSERPRGTGSSYLVVRVSRQFSNFLFESFWFLLWRNNSSWNHGMCWTVNNCCLGNRWRGKIWSSSTIALFLVIINFLNCDVSISTRQQKRLIFVERHSKVTMIDNSICVHNHLLTFLVIILVISGLCSGNLSKDKLQSLDSRK